jgi:hypothetical protein
VHNIEQKLTVIAVCAVHAKLYSEGIGLCAEERSFA